MLTRKQIRIALGLNHERGYLLERVDPHQFEVKVWQGGKWKLVSIEHSRDEALHLIRRFRKMDADADA